jgi:hypothetical protein
MAVSNRMTVEMVLPHDLAVEFEDWADHRELSSGYLWRACQGRGVCLGPPEQAGCLGIADVGCCVPRRGKASLDHVGPVQDALPERARPEPKVDQCPGKAGSGPGNSASAAALARTNVKGWRTTHARYGSWPAVPCPAPCRPARGPVSPGHGREKPVASPRPPGGRYGRAAAGQGRKGCWAVGAWSRCLAASTAARACMSCTASTVRRPAVERCCFAVVAKGLFVPN